jgi:hypothetical protein
MMLCDFYSSNYMQSAHPEYDESIRSKNFEQDLFLGSA